MFEKEAKTLQQQIEILKSRGLIINEEDDAVHYLSHISYYRLAGYWWPMQVDKVEHIFKQNSCFSDVIAL